MGVEDSAAEVTEIAVNANSNVYVTGYIHGNLDGQTLTGSYDLFITKYFLNSDPQ
jgi:hypothetical protein